VDKRTDIWAFGVVLYEMLVGKQLFEGETSSHRLAAVLTREPDFTTVPVQVRRLLKACLEKDPARRLRDIGDWATLIDVTPVAAPSVVTATSARRRWLMPTALAATVLAATGLAFMAGTRTRATAPAPEIRADLALPTTPDGLPFALSPDGTRVAFVAFEKGQRRLSVRDLSTGQVTTLPDTDGASSPFWSPDGRSLGFFADYRLKRIDLDGAKAQVLATVQGLRGDGTWSRSNVIVFAVPGAVPTLSRVEAAGGPVTQATTVTTGQQSHLAPRFLADSQHFFYVVIGAEPSLWLGALDGAVPRRVAVMAPNTDSAAEFVDPGWVVRVRQGALEAQVFDAAKAELVGQPITLEKNVPVDSQTMGGAFSVSAAGPILWRHGGGERRQLQWVTRAGEQLGTLGDIGDSTLFSPELSPDGTRVLTMRGRTGESDIWLLDGQRNSRVTLDATDERIGIWSPGGDRIVFTSNRSGSYDLYVRTLGRDGDQLLVHSPDYKRANSWSPDGRFLIYASSDGQGDLMLLPTTGSRQPVPFINTRFNEQQAAFSPDGRWVAYQSDESGRFEVYLRAFPGPGQQVPVSVNGGGSVRWARSGKELFYLAPDLRLMSVAVDLTGDRPVIGTPMPLFQTAVNRAINKQQYDVAPDGRFLLLNDQPMDSAEPVRLLVNWRPRATP
jgi:Tol biopolymer transport system component